MTDIDDGGTPLVSPLACACNDQDCPEPLHLEPDWDCVCCGADWIGTPPADRLCEDCRKHQPGCADCGCVWPAPAVVPCPECGSPNVTYLPVSREVNNA